MSRQSQAAESTMGLYSKVVVLIVFVALLGGFIFYLNKHQPNIKQVAMETLAEQFRKSVANAHWQWQAEGRPPRVIVIQYDKSLDDDRHLVEKDRRPVAMSHLGWPTVTPDSKGCAKLWDTLLNRPLLVEGFKVYAEFYDGVQITGNELDSYCRYRMSVGPYFDYATYTGDVTRVIRQ